MQFYNQLRENFTRLIQLTKENCEDETKMIINKFSNKY